MDSDSAGAGVEGLPVASWFRSGRRDLAIRVYLEGDGRAFRSRYRVSLDPTPNRPLGLELAIADPYQGPTYYLGRPCQYRVADHPACTPFVWTAARFGLEALAAMDAELDRLRSRHSSPARIELVGYSGGGVVAALLAARRVDIARLTTIAAPLDVRAWTDRAGVPRLAASASPMDALDTLRSIEQFHFAGSADQRVPSAIGRSYHEALGEEAPSEWRVLEGMTHDGWVDAWPSLLGTDQAELAREVCESKRPSR